MDQDLYYATRKLYDAARKGSFEAEGRGLSNREYVNELIKQCVNVSEGMFAAAAFGHKELVELCMNHGASDWNWGMYGAAEGGHKELVDLFIKKGANEWNYGMYGAAQGGHKELVDLFIKKGANEWNYGMRGAVRGGHKELVDLFVKKGANNWNDGLFLSKTTSLKIFFIDQGADDKNVFPLFYKDICKLYHLSNGVLVSKLLRRYIARFRGNKLRNEKVIIDDKHESTLDQVFVSPPDTIVKFRDTIYKIKGFVFYVVKKRFN